MDLGHVSESSVFVVPLGARAAGDGNLFVLYHAGSERAARPPRDLGARSLGRPGSVRTGEGRTIISLTGWLQQGLWC